MTWVKFMFLSKFQSGRASFKRPPTLDLPKWCRLVHHSHLLPSRSVFPLKKTSNPCKCMFSLGLKALDPKFSLLALFWRGFNVKGRHLSFLGRNLSVVGRFERFNTSNTHNFAILGLGWCIESNFERISWLPSVFERLKTSYERPKRLATSRYVLTRPNLV